MSVTFHDPDLRALWKKTKLGFIMQGSAIACAANYSINIC